MSTATTLPVNPSPAAVEFALLQSWLASSSTLRLPLHHIESQQADKGREVQRLLLQNHLQQRGTGDVGPALRVPTAGEERIYSHRRLGTRRLTTVFGAVELVRMGYARPGLPSIFPLDQALALPARSFSYELQRRLVKAAAQNPFLESVETIAELTGVSVSKRSLEEILPDAAQDFDAFYRQRPPDPASGSLLVAAVDCKGIPVVKPLAARPALRLTKGQKSNKKRMATVATVFTRAPWVRTPQQVLESLFPTSCRTSRDKSIPPRPENKRVWASLLKGKTVVIREVAEEMDRRDRSRSLTRVALTDGERALQIRVKLKLNVTLILDLITCWRSFGKLPTFSMPRAVWQRIFGSWTGPCGFYSVKWVKWSKGSGRRSPSAACPAPNAKQWRQSPATFTGIERACNMTNTSLTGGPLPVVRSKAPARTSSKIAWSAPGCAGPSRWLRRSSNSEPSTSPETLIATGNSTSSRINSGYIRPTGPSFQSSRTLLNSD